MYNVSDIKDELVRKWRYSEFVTDKSGVRTIELVGASFVADQPAILGTPNQAYITREIKWYESQSLCVWDIPEGTPAIWNQISSCDGLINSNYGYLVHSEENGNQYRNTLAALKADETTRRAVMIYQRPTMHVDYKEDNKSDFICTNAVQYLIRDGKLVAIVQMRSNDVFFGYRNDYAWQKHVQRQLAFDLGIEAGDIIWNAGSLHLYERHFKLLSDEV